MRRYWDKILDDWVYEDEEMKSQANLRPEPEEKDEPEERNLVLLISSLNNHRES